MPKVAPKQAPAPAARPTVKADPKKAEKEKQAQARAALINAEVPEAAEMFKGFFDADAAAQGAFLNTAIHFRDKREEHEFTEDECREFIILAIAEAKGFDAEELRTGKKISGVQKKPMELHPSEYSYVSRIKRLVFPKEETKKQFEALLAKVEKGEDVSLKRLETVAKGNTDPGKAQRGAPQKGAGKGTAKSSDKFDTEDDAKNALSAWIGKCMKSDMDLDAIQTMIAEQIAEWEAAQNQS